MLFAAAYALCGANVAAPSIQSLRSKYRAAPTAATRAQLLSYIQAHPNEPNAALARFTLGMTAFGKGDYEDAVEQLHLAQGEIGEEAFPRLGDYVAYYLAAAQAESKKYDEVPRALALFEKPAPLLSPLDAKATLLAAQGYLENHSPADAIRVLREGYKVLPQPEGDFTLASAYRAQGELPQAAILYQRVYFEFPSKPAAADASAAIENLKRTMGKEYPPPVPQQMLDRGEKWIAAREYGKARHEFESVAPLLAGLARDQARVRIGAVDFFQGSLRGAFRYLKTLRLSSSEADAEREYYLAECARKMNDDAEMTAAIQRLAKRYPRSVWRLKALVSAGNRYLLLHQTEKYEPLYQAAYQTFPSDSATAYCHWKVTWNAYLTGRNDAADLLKEQVTQYPADGKTAAALYFLGRFFETHRQAAAAHACYRKLVDEFPHYYYGVLAQSRIAQAKLSVIAPLPETASWLAGVAFPDNPNKKQFASLDPSPATKLRIDRARMLSAAGFPDWAEAELRFGAKNDGQPHVLAMELARTAATPHRGLRFMKVLVPDHLSIPFESAPAAFWQALFPMPFRDQLVKAAKLQGLDPNIVAALIRQESEFNPGALSPAKAYGLTQIVPATGRELAERAGIRGFDTPMLFDPETNLKLGTTYLHSMLNQWNGRWEPTLASYNAGKGRVDEWLKWSSYREPAEFVESIPFTETREYVQAVLRNAELYRRIYEAKVKEAQPEIVSKSQAPGSKARPARQVAPVSQTRQRGKKRTHPIS
ncbi:MAG: transglycosylase SLT domain-containing protein [Acidobacteriota bacterium]|nr:transglycosylase SLT domain-containing protein [Acidobacteriota bacterium]